MAFRFSPKDGSVEDGVRRMAAEQLDRALDEAAVGGPRAAFAVRKRIKKLRALLKLVRASLHGARGVEDKLAEAARGLGSTRDGQVLRERLAEVGGDLTPDQRAQMLARLPSPILGTDDAALAAAVETMQAVRRGIAKWRFDGNGFETLAKGALRSYARLRARARAMSVGATDEKAHDLRKAAKAHWHQLGMLRDLDPAGLVPRRELAGELQEALGEHHDLSQLAAALRSTGAPEGPNLVVLDRIGARMTDLAHGALERALLLAISKPRQAVRDLRARWDATMLD